MSAGFQGLSDAVRDDIRNGFRGARVSTIHAFCLDILKTGATEAGLPTDLTIATREQVLVMKADAVAFGVSAAIADRDNGIRTLLMRFSVDRIRSLLLDMFDLEGFEKNAPVERLSDPLATPDERQAHHESQKWTAALTAIFTQIQKRYTDIKIAKNQLDFDDILTHAENILTQIPSVRDHYRSLIRQLLVDEFQDTDPRQWRILRQLTDQNAGLTQFVVGDVKQSIYGFRGADPALFQDTLATFETDRNSQRTSLLENFRSKSAIILFVNACFKAAFDSDPAALVTYQSMQVCRPDADGGRVEIAILPSKQPTDEADWIAEWLKREAITAFRDVAILFRQRRSMALFKNRLETAGIPAVIPGSVGDATAGEIVTMLLLLAVLDAPSDSVSWIGVLKSPLFGISDESLAALALEWPEAGIFEQLQSVQSAQSAESLRKMGVLSPDIDSILSAAKTYDLWTHKMVSLQPSHLVETILNEQGVIAHLATDADAPIVLANVRWFFKKLAQIADHNPGTEWNSVFRWANLIRTRPDTRESECAPSAAINAVQLLTIHESKGLEFPTVFVAECGKNYNFSDSETLVHHRRFGLGITHSVNEGKNPHAQQIKEQIRMETRSEERRLFYVAATRARNTLVLVGRTTVDLAKPRDSEAIPKSTLALLLAIGELSPPTPQTIGWNAIDSSERASPFQSQSREPTPAIPAFVWSIPGNPVRIPVWTEVISLTPAPSPGGRERGDSNGLGYPQTVWPCGEALRQLSVSALLDAIVGTPLAMGLTRYALQLRLYAIAIRLMKGADRVRTILYFSRTGESTQSDIDAEILDQWAELIASPQALFRAPGEAGVRTIAPDIEGDPANPDPAITGTLIHHVFDTVLRCVDANLPNHPLLLGLPPDRAEKILKRVATDLATFQNSPTFATLQSATTLITEMPFTLRLGPIIVRGRCDIVAELSGLWTVIDYKSGGIIHVTA